MASTQVLRRGAASLPLHPRIADHYMTSYHRDYKPPTTATGCSAAAGYPTEHTGELICRPRANNTGECSQKNGKVSCLCSSPSVPAAVAPPCEGGAACAFRLEDTENNSRRFKTTYGDEFNSGNSVRNPIAEHHLCSSPPATSASTCTSGLKLFRHAPPPVHTNQRTKTLHADSSAHENFASVNSFKTTYNAKFNDASSVRASLPASSWTDTRLITSPVCGPPRWGVNEKPPPYVPGAEFTYPAEKPLIRHVDKSTTHDSYQHRTRKHEVISYDAGKDAISRKSVVATTGNFSRTIGTPTAIENSSSTGPGDKNVSCGQFKTEEVMPLSGTNPSATVPRRYRLYEPLQALDRRHETFALGSAIDREKRKAAEQAAAKLPAQPSFTKPSLHDMFLDYQQSLPPRDKCGVNGCTLETYGEVCPVYGEVANAGLDAFHESVNKFAPVKALTSTRIPYCKPWQPLTKIVHSDAEPKSFAFTPLPIAASDGFIPVCPTARYDGKVAGRKNKDWKPEGCTVEA